MKKADFALGAWFVFTIAFGCGGQSIRQDGSADDDIGRGGGAVQGGASNGGNRGGNGAAGPAGGTGAYGGTASGTGGSYTGGTGFGGSAVIGGTGPIGGTGFSGTGGAQGGFAARGGGSTAGAGPVVPPGPVLCGGVECPAPRACCLSNSRCFDPGSEPNVCPRPDPAPDDGFRTCASNAHCLSTETCMLSGSYLCEGEGRCVALTSCPGSGYAVCGCDGNSYPNVETACRAGANAPMFGGGGCGDTVDANLGEAEPRWVTLCGADAHCGSGERCCALSGICYPATDPGRCQRPPEGTRYPCTADDQCFPGYEFCSGPGCSGPGGCVHMDEIREDCGVRLEPVCGCDGVSYTSAACAAAEGVRVASQGACMPSD